MIAFPAYPAVRKVDHRRRFELIEPYAHHYEQGGRSYRLVAPKGFVCDLASIPRVTWSLFPPGRLDKAAVFHDLLYRRGGSLRAGEFQLWDAELWTAMAGVTASLRGQPEPGWVDVEAQWTRKQADRLFRWHLDADPDGPRWWRRAAAYRAVRWFGGGSWRG